MTAIRPFVTCGCQLWYCKLLWSLGSMCHHDAGCVQALCALQQAGCHLCGVGHALVWWILCPMSVASCAMSLQYPLVNCLCSAGDIMGSGSGPAGCWWWSTPTWTYWAVPPTAATTSPNCADSCRCGMCRLVCAMAVVQGRSVAYCSA